MRPLLSRFLAALGLVLAVTAQAAPSREWAIIDLGAFGTTGSAPAAINNRGEIVGSSTKAFAGQLAEISRAFLWSDLQMRDLGAPELFFSQANAINDRGTVAVTSGGDKLYLWKDGQWIWTGVTGTPLDMNRSEAVVGQRWNGTAFHAFLWQDGVLNDLGTLGGPISGAFALNDKGVVVGVSELPAPGVAHAFVYKDGTMRDLGTVLGHEDSTANDINDRGIIVGFASTTGDDSVAFIGDVNGIRPLFDLPAPHAAVAINNHGAVIGTIGEGSFLYEDGVLTRLEDIPAVRTNRWTRLYPVDINDRGWITGFGVHEGTGPGLKAFLLRPAR